MNIIFSDGTEFPCASMLKTPGGEAVHIMLATTDYVTAATLLSDNEKTSVMTYGDTTVNGYTSLRTLREEYGCITARMEKPNE